ncbi:hypothetical protein DXG01_006761 [Tephrocybe rancida]|nr:hypothetical protein DXG01_006761 [Tephrocybe rancida]
MASSTPHDADMRPPPSLVIDPASSLRELALKTLKSRRKPQTDTPIPAVSSRPPVSDVSFQLDYGQDEISQPRDIPQSPPLSTPKSPVIHTPKPATTSPKPLSVSTPKPTPVPDNQAREEGEISDEEDVQPAPIQRKSSTPLPQLSNSISRGPTYPTPTTSSQAQPESSKNKPPLFERLSDPPVIFDSLPFADSETGAMQIDTAPATPDSRYVLDPSHVRPGVAMNQDQYDKAKDIVLDLLGWGVEPHYLVDCGLTREVVYYVFTELNLRLPQNLDTTGLVPFTPEDALELQKTAMMPPPPPPPQSRRPSQSRPASSTRTPSPSPASAQAPMTSSQIVESPRPVSTSDLHDMEQQRRQELMARKAAIASKKSKHPPPVPSSSPRSVPAPSSLPSSSNQDTDMNVDSVEDFLKSIGSTSAAPSDVAGSSATFTEQSDDMEVDEIPGLSRTNSYKAPVLVPYNTTPSPFPSSMISPTQSSQGPLSPAECPPTSTESASTTFSSISIETTTSSSSSSPTETQLPEGPALQRRGMKRPVASDFVDFDSESRASSSNGYRHSNGHNRRRVAGFASVASQPRCIIDVSDSEGEGDGDVSMRDVESSWRGGYASPVPTKPFIAHLNTNGWATPPVLTSTPTIASLASTPSGTMSPAALMAKETEIQRMREIIAQKERKLKEAKVALEVSSRADVTVKREDTPVTLLPDGGPSLPSRLATPTLDPPQPFAQEDHLEPSVSSDPVTIPRSSDHGTPVTMTPSIGSPFRLALPTSD